uniref:GTP-binding protein n=1 Tax=Ignisphaera aggregans TaxID=334771 RepID=A0A7J2U3I0_9CREN
MNSGRRAICLHDYLDVPAVSYDVLRKRVLEIYKERVRIPKSSSFRDHSKRVAFRYMVKAEKAFQYIVTVLGRIARLPTINSLSPFYAELLELATNNMYDKLRREASQAVKIISNMWKEYRKRILEGDINAKRISIEFVGRALSVIKRKVKTLPITKDISYIVHSTPCIDFEKPLIIVSGMPQVGKSTFISKVSTAKPKTSPYPFTTKNVIIGHIMFGDVVIQIMDTPGILDRSLEEMNEIERKAVAALRHLKAVVIYIIDVSKDSYYTLEQQVRVLDSVKGLVGRDKIIIVLNKVDKTEKDVLEKVKNIITNMGYDKHIEMSALLGINVWVAIVEAISLYDKLFGTRYGELIDLYSSSTISNSGNFSSS